MTPAVLIPRPESALLWSQRQFVVVPIIQPPPSWMGTGSGCLAVSVALALPRAWSLSTWSAEAPAVAQRNMVQHGCDARIDCLQGTFWPPLDAPAWRHKIDVMVSNPPYIADGDLATLQPEVGCFEPRLALAGGPDGMVSIGGSSSRRRLSKTGGALLMEVGLGQKLLPSAGSQEESGWFSDRCGLAG